MTKLIYLFVITCCVIPAVAQQDMGPADMPEMGPPPEMAQIRGMLGTWAGDFHFRMTPEEEFSSSQVRMEVTTILDGAAQHSHFTGQMMGMPFEGMGTLAFNRDKKEWQNVWIDNLSAYPQMSRGTLVDGTLVLEGRDVYQGQDMRMRDTTRMVADGELHWHMDVSYDDGKTWFTSMKAVYRRK